MQIISTEVTEANGSTEGFLVEFLGDGGESVSVRLAQSESGDLSRDNALAKAQVVLLQASRFGLSEDGGDDASSDNSEPSDAVESLRQEQESRERGGSALQEGLEDTYPASDPVSATYTSTAGVTENKH
ncbi:MAG: hypothetical protein ACK4M8_00345 [Allorhizobium sp.]|jgi:hypothetical protein